MIYQVKVSFDDEFGPEYYAVSVDSESAARVRAVVLEYERQSKNSGRGTYRAVTGAEVLPNRYVGVK